MAPPTRKQPVDASGSRGHGRNDASPAALAVMAKIEDAARSAFDGEVVAAWDLLNLPVAAKDEASAASASADAARLEAGADAADAFKRGEIAAPPPRKKAPPRLKKKPQAPSKTSKVR